MRKIQVVQLFVHIFCQAGSGRVHFLLCISYGGGVESASCSFGYWIAAAVRLYRYWNLHLGLVQEAEPH